MFRGWPRYFYQCVRCWTTSNDPELVRPLRRGSAEHSDGLAHSTSLDRRREPNTSMALLKLKYTSPEETTVNLQWWTKITEVLK